MMNQILHRCNSRLILTFLSKNQKFFFASFSQNLKFLQLKSLILCSSPRNVIKNGNIKNVRCFCNNSHESEIQKEDDKIIIGEGSWKEVYKGVLTTQLKLLKIFSISTSVIGFSLQPLIFLKLSSTNLAAVISLCSFFGIFTVATPALIHWVAKKYVTKLEYDPRKDIYSATTLSFFLREKKIHFNANEVYRPSIPGMFTSFSVKNRPLFVDPSMFDDIEHYARIMGFNKPVDLSFEDREEDSRSNEEEGR